MTPRHHNFVNHILCMASSVKRSRNGAQIMLEAYTPRGKYQIGCHWVAQPITQSCIIAAFSLTKSACLRQRSVEACLHAHESARRVACVPSCRYLAMESRWKEKLQTMGLNVALSANLELSEGHGPSTAARFRYRTPFLYLWSHILHSRLT